MSYEPSPTGELFLADRTFIKGVLGPVGGGKSTLALMDLLSRAAQQTPFNGLRRTKFGVVRNTAAQLKATVKPLIDEWLVTIPVESGGSATGEWRITDNTFEIQLRLPDGTRMHTELCLLAADTPDDVRRLLSLQLSAAWVEEAREIDEEVFKALLGRVGRFPSKVAGGVAYPGVIFSTNAPMLETYWHNMIVNPPTNAAIFIQPEAIDADGNVNPLAENLRFLDENYYPNLIAANSEEWLDVYLRNKFGAGNAGQAVYKSTFKKSFHISKEHLVPMTGTVYPLIVGMDNGLQAGAGILQQDPRGIVNLLGECFVPAHETMGVETFMDRLLIPYLNNKFKAGRDRYVFVLDPACFQRSQVNEATIAQAVMARGFHVVKASTNDPEKRQAALEGLLNRAVDGGPGFRIDPRLKHIADGLEWGFRFKKAPHGQLSTTRDKTHHSHTIEGLEYAALHVNAKVSGDGFSPFRTKAREVRRSTHVYV